MQTSVVRNSVLKFGQALDYAQIVLKKQCGFNAVADFTEFMPAPNRLIQQRHLAFFHGVEKLGIVLSRLKLINQKFCRLQLIHRIHHFAQHPDFLQQIRGD